MAARLSKYRVSTRFALVLPLIVAACGEAEQQVEEQIVRPVKTIVVGAAESGGIRSFPARIESSRRADVSFRVPGTVVELPVLEGDTVEEGQLIARLDQPDFQVVVDDRQATLDRLAKDFERAAELLPKGFVPRQTYDRLEAEVRSARAALQQAQLDLGYTSLTAPFAGQIAQRFVEAFEEVQAKQTIVSMRDISQLEVRFDLPEQVVIQLRAAQQQGEGAADVFASFDTAAEEKFKLAFKEVAVSADQATQTFQVAYTMDAPQDLLVLPGMTANVTVDLSTVLGTQTVSYVPVEAVVGTNELDAKIWVVDEATMTVSSRRVRVGSLLGRQIAVTEGLEPGDRVVVAGAAFLVEGMEVSLMADVEQAAERPEDRRIREAAAEQSASVQEN